MLKIFFVYKKQNCYALLIFIQIQIAENSTIAFYLAGCKNGSNFRTHTNVLSFKRTVQVWIGIANKIDVFWRKPLQISFGVYFF